MKSSKIIYCLAVSILTLSGCATKSYQTGVSSGKFVEASPPGQKNHVRIVKEYVAVPIPGQLRPIPSTAAEQLEKKPLLTKEQAVADAALVVAAVAELAVAAAPVVGLVPAEV